MMNRKIPKPSKFRAEKIAGYDSDGNTVVEDTKGFRTPEYIIKRKLMLSVHGISINEI